MAGVVDSLLIRVGVDGVPQAIAGFNQLGAAAASTANRLNSLFTAFSGLSFGLVALRGVAASAASTFVSLSGVQVAEQFIRIEKQLRILTGSGEEASKMLERITELGKRTVFDTADVAAFATAMYAAGVAGDELEQELSALLDVAAGLGVAREDMTEFTRNILQIRAGAGTLIDIKQLFRAAPGAGAVIGAGLGQERMTMEQVADLMAQRGGRAVYEALVRGAEKLMPGAATQLTPLTAIANLMESFRLAFRRTGELVLNIAMPFVNALIKVMNAFGRVNDALGGVPGLIIAVIGGLSVMAIALASVYHALAGFSAMLRLSTAALASQASAATASAAGAAAGALGQAGAAAGAGILGRLGGALGALLRWLPGLLGRVSLATGLGAAAELIGGAVGGEFGRFLSILGRVGSAAGIGAVLGTKVFPGVGTAIGAIAGIGYAAWGMWREGQQPPQVQASTKKVEENTAQTVEELRRLNAHFTGGGQLGRYIISRMEMELAMARLLAGGVG